MELYILGLIEADDKLLAAITQLAREDPGFHRYLPYHPARHPDLWSDVLKSPSEVRQTLMNLIPCENDDRLQSLLSSAANSPPAYDVVQAIWQELRERAKFATEPAIRPKLFSALFHLAPLLPVEERLAMRRDFLEYFRETPLPINKWPEKVIEDIRLSREFYPNGECIPWEDDALSAVLSWSSDMGRQMEQMPEDGVAEKSTGVFSYLAQAMVSYTDEGLAGSYLNNDPVGKPLHKSVWKRQPLQPPFEATPWQQARDLHLRRPDLRFPDHVWARPGRIDS